MLYCLYDKKFEIKNIDYSINGLNYAFENIQNNKPSHSTDLPIKLVCSSKWNYRLINGYHRLAQHIIDKKSTIFVQIIYK